MIPIRLEFEAFGPFANKQVIDFTQMDHNRLFLISGQTGSGKTTIFDAITFSLFGQASGSTRQSDSFKSDFAEDKTVCYVEFEFVLKGQSYVVRREPIQFRLKRNSNLVKENSTASLTLENGTIISGASSVDKYIEQLLGINADQFKKIVMLPQGEFRKFLSDDSVEKQKILRKIFGTKILDDFTEQLRINTNEVKSKLDTLMTQNLTYIDSIVWLDNDILRQEIMDSHHDISFIIKRLKEFHSNIKTSTNETKKLLDKLYQQKQEINLPYYQEINQKFDLLSQTTKEFEELQNQKDKYALLENQLISLNFVKDVIPNYQFIKTSKQQIKALQEKLLNCDLKLKENEANIKDKEIEYSTIKQQKDEIPILIKQIEQIKYQQELFIETQSIQKEIQRIHNQCEEAEKNQIAVKSFYNYAVLHQQISELKTVNSNLKELEQNLLHYQALATDYEKAKTQYQNVFEAFINGQASMLAIELKDNLPCPVCGSTDHPSPAKMKNEQVSQVELDNAQQQYESVTKQVESLLATCKHQVTINQISEDFQHILDYLPVAQQLLCKNEKAIQTLTEQIHQIILREDLSRISPIPKADSILKKLTDIEKSILVLKQNYENNHVRFISIQQKINQDTNLESLALEQARLEKEIKVVQEKADTLENNLKLLSISNERTLEAKQQMNEQLIVITKEMEQREINFNHSLYQAEMDITTFLSLKELLININAMQDSLAQYKNAISIKSALMESLKKQLEGKEPVDLLILKEKIDIIDSEIEQMNKQYLTFSSALSTNHDIINKLKDSQKKYQDLNSKFATINKLFEVANGKYSDRINFERYVLASYFNDVIMNANLRLEKMTSSRYTLIRRAEKEKGNKSSGLALDVFDTYTGKSRHVNTLSGGESFKIALSLALGLADIISQNSGGIELNTMFIDEGFGSLDSNSLDSAIACLNDLRASGRYIGIISHVSELKEKISSKIIVVQQPTGSYIES